MEEKKTITKKSALEKYNECKSKHAEAICMFRVGDFYEMYEKDAIDASELLGITLSSRRDANNTAIQLAGFPFHALDTYLPRLVRAGRRIVISD